MHQKLEQSKLNKSSLGHNNIIGLQYILPALVLPDSGRGDRLLWPLAVDRVLLLHVRRDPRRHLLQVFAGLQQHRVRAVHLNDPVPAMRFEQPRGQQVLQNRWFKVRQSWINQQWSLSKIRYFISLLFFPFVAHRWNARTNLFQFCAFDFFNSHALHFL